MNIEFPNDKETDDILYKMCEEIDRSEESEEIILIEKEKFQNELDNILEEQKEILQKECANKESKELINIRMDIMDGIHISMNIETRRSESINYKNKQNN